MEDLLSIDIHHHPIISNDRQLQGLDRLGISKTEGVSEIIG